MATVAVEKTAAAARDVIAICFNMTCLHLMLRGSQELAPAEYYAMHAVCVSCRSGNSRAHSAAFRTRSGWPGRSRSARSARFRGGDRENGHAHLLERHLARGQPGDPGPARSRLLAGLDRLRRRPRLRGLRPGPRPPCGAGRALGPLAGTQPDQDAARNPRADARGDPPLRAQGRALCASDVLGDERRRRTDLGRRRFLPVPALRLPFTDARRHAHHARPLPHHSPADSGERADRRQGKLPLSQLLARRGRDA